MQFSVYYTQNKLHDDHQLIIIIIRKKKKAKPTTNYLISSPDPKNSSLSSGSVLRMLSTFYFLPCKKSPQFKKEKNTSTSPSTTVL